MLAMLMRRMEAGRRHQGLWSQCSKGSMVGERWMVSRYLIVGAILKCGTSGQVGRGLLQNRFCENSGAGVGVSWIGFEEVTPDFRKGREDSW